MVFFSPPRTIVSGRTLTRATERTPGTPRRIGTCSVSYTSLKMASRLGSTSIAALNT